MSGLGLISISGVRDLIHPSFRLRFQNQAGLSMVELLGVSLIISVLSLMVFQVYDQIHDRARWAKSRDELRTIEVALEAYRVEKSHYPDRLSLLVDEGFLRHDVTFETPWGNKRTRPHYFYAVDDPGTGRSMAYALGDPGPLCTTKLILKADSSQPLPCGPKPTSEAYSFYVGSDLTLEGHVLDFVRGHASLRVFRDSCRNPKPALVPGTGCDLRTES